MRAIYVALVAIWVGVSASNLSAAQIAFDNAGDSAYNNFNPNSTTYPNGGYGWGSPWQGQMSMASSSLNGSGDPLGTGDINSPRTPAGRAWEIPAAVDHDLTFTAWRQFSGALLPGQTFSIDVDNGAVAPVGGPDGFAFAEGFAIANGVSSFSGAGTGFNFAADPQDYPDYVVGTATAFYITNVPLTERGVHVEVTQLEGAQVRVSITSLATGAASQSLILPDTVPMTTVTMINNAPIGLDRDLYFNNVAITPEPASLVLFPLAVAGIILRRHRPTR